MKFTVAVNVDGESKDLSSVVASIVSVMLKPYVDLLAKLVEAGRSEPGREGTGSVSRFLNGKRGLASFCGKIWPAVDKTR